LAALDVVCIDGLDTIAGQSEWEAALFQLYNQVRDGQSTLWFAARTSVQQIAISLPDLLSRLRACLSVPIVELTDEDKLAAVQLRARHRGFDLSDEVGQFLLRRFPRDMSSLFALLEQLDRESLAAQRRITIPFVKEVISHGG
jgi:DnaA family protein